MAALSMQTREDISAFIAAFTGSHRYILDYLTEEVLEQQAGEIQQYLMETALLNRLCADLCDAVTEIASISHPQAPFSSHHAFLRTLGFVVFEWSAQFLCCVFVKGEISPRHN
jgi:hypothetical protein